MSCKMRASHATRAMPDGVMLGNVLVDAEPQRGRGPQLRGRSPVESC
jgi:hypothetical protein